MKPAGIPNILTALEENQKIAATDPDPQRRAVALTWLFHLVSDIHQPLHTSQLFSVGYPDGDQGGNQICIRTRPGNEPVTLHRFWDEVIIRSERLTVLQKLATFLRSRQEFAKPQLSELATTDFEGWAKESFQAATAAAYQAGTLTGAPKNQKQDCREVAAAPVLSLDYIATARRVADRRIVLAGYRLADLLARVLGPSASGWEDESQPASMYGALSISVPMILTSAVARRMIKKNCHHVSGGGFNPVIGFCGHAMYFLLG